MIAVKKTNNDDGFTLVELLVTCLIMGLVFTVVATMFISISSAQRIVTGVTTSTTDAQVAASTIEKSLRNSSEFKLTVPASTTDQLLVARVANQTNTLSWSCQAWYYSSTTGSIYTTKTADGTKITAPTAMQLQTWPVLVTKVTPRTGTTIFTVDASKVIIAFNATPSGQPSIAIQTTAVKQTGTAEALSCY